MVDEWHLFPLYQRFADGSLGVSDLFRQINEYRQFFPNLIFVTVASLTHSDSRYLMVLTFLFACLVSYNIYHLANLTITGSLSIRIATFFLSNLLIFSPVQHENWLQGQQLIYFLPIACLTTALLICFSNLSLATRFLICGMLATIATFSSANGFVCWLVLLPMLFVSADRDALPKRRLFSLLWLVALSLNLALYLFQFQTVPHHPSLSAFLSKPIITIVYFVALLGRPLSMGPVSLAAVLGSVLLLSFVVLAWASLKSRGHEVTESRRTICWLMLGAYSILTAMLVTIGRVGFGLEQVKGSPRYATFTLYLGVALIHLVAVRVYSGKRGWFSRRIAATTAGVLAAGLIVLHVGIYLLGVRQLSNFRIALLESKACVRFEKVVVDECASPLISRYPDVKNYFGLADSLGMLRPPIIKPDNFAISQINSTQGEFGKFERLENSGGDIYTASGTAFLPVRNEPAHAIIISYERPGEPPAFLGPSGLNSNRDWVSALLRRGVYKDSRWSRTFVLSPRPVAETTVSAWAVDVYAGNIYKLAGTHSLK